MRMSWLHYEAHHFPTMPLGSPSMTSKNAKHHD